MELKKTFLKSILPIILIGILILGGLSFWKYLNDVWSTYQAFKYPSLLSDNSSLGINLSEIDSIPAIFNAIPKQACSNINDNKIAELISTSSNWKDFPSKDCFEWKVSDKFSVLDVWLFNKSTLMVKVFNSKTNSWDYIKVIESRWPDYPGWSFAVSSVDNNGTIYLKYGGYKYTLWGGDGTKNYRITFRKLEE